MPYSDYFALSPTYHPVVNEATIANELWQDTYPHNTFVKLLIQTEKMLSRADSKNVKPIWIHGAYGTGKTRIAWTLKELLTCDPSELKVYFDSYTELRGETALRDRLLGLKEGDRIVAAMRFSSTTIRDIDDLVIAIYQTVTRALAEQGMEILQNESLEGAVRAWLEDKVNRAILTAILKEEPYCHDGDLPDSAEKVREMLNSGAAHDRLLRKLLAIARERRLLAITFDVDSLIAWLDKIIEANGLTALVIIWDEFSDFLKANRSQYSDFQKLAHAASKIPFYFIIVTHMTSQMFGENDPGARAVLDRFSIFPIDMPEYTAFKLIGHALQVKPGMEEEWRQISSDLNNRLESARRSVKKMLKTDKVDKELDVDDFRRILPIHPYAALILKNIAQNFSANQRSMFDFIADTDDRAKAFQYFIHTHEPGDILSIDQLWHYFYVSGKGKLDLGRGNLEANIRLVMDTYPVFADKYAPKPGSPDEDTPEQRVLKTVIMLQALRYLAPEIEHFKASEDNLETAFQGVDSLDLGQARIVADKLVADKVLFVDCGIYQVPLGNAVDQAKIIDEIEKTRKNTRTSILVSGFSAWDILPTSEPLKTRLVIRKLTAGDFTRELNSLINEAGRDWALKVAMIFARDDAEVDQAQQFLTEALANDRANNIIFIDATATTLPPERWEAYIEAVARKVYFAGKDNSQSQRENDQANSVIRDWAMQIRNGKFTLHSGREARPRYLSGGDELLAELKNIVQRRYPACWDFNQGVKGTYFSEKFGPAVIKGGINEAAQNPITKDSIGFWLKDIGVDDYWRLLPQHPLAKLRRDVEKKAEKAFARGGSGRMEILEIIDEFIKEGFMPVTLYAWLTGYLLKEFADSQYRYSDGSIGNVMDADRLAEMIERAFKYLQHPNTTYRKQYIEVLTEEQRAFTALTARIFNLAGDESLDHIAIKLGQIARDWGYPFWAFSHAPDAPALQEFVELFIQYLNPEAHNRASHGEVASAIGKLIIAKPEAEAHLKALFTQENLQKGMIIWLDNFENGELPALARQIGAPDYLADVRSELSLDAAWLWDDKVCGEVVRIVLDDYRLAAKSVENGYLSHANSREACLEGWRQKLYGLHIPYPALLERYPEQRQLLKAFDDLAKRKILTRNQLTKLLEMVKDNDPILHQIFDNATTVFRTVFAHILKDLPEKEITVLYNAMPASSFRDERETFENELQARVRGILDKLKRSRLLAKWRDLTGADSVGSLVTAVGTPMTLILQELFGSQNCAEAIKACKILENENASDGEMDFAMGFLNANADQLRNLADQSLADKAFDNFIIGKKSAILKDAAKVRARLGEKLGPNVGQWLEYPAWHDIVHDLATEEYKNNGVQAVRQKLAAMSAEQAKNLLTRLGEDSFEVGLKILGD